LNRVPVIVVALVATLLSQPASASNDPPVTVTADEQERLGVATMTAAEQQESESVYAIVRVIDPTTLLTIEADLDAASSAAAVSGEEYRRVEGLAAQDQSASLRAVGAARAQAVADASRLQLLKRRLQVEWGPAFGMLSASDLRALTAALASGEAVLMRADSPARPAGITGEIAIRPNPKAKAVVAAPLGLAAVVDPRMQTTGLIGLVRGPAAAMLRPGSVLPGEIRPGTSVAGIVIPRSAIVRHNGTDWAYVKSGPQTFERREIVAPQSTERGWFVRENFAAGDTIVSSGAGALLAVERANEAPASD
jgi:hypothetical protein